MRKGIRLILFLVLLLMFIYLTVFSQPQTENVEQTQNGWSSVDDVFIKQEMDIMVKKPTSRPITIGYTSKEVQEVMGVPDRIDKEGLVYYYRQSPIYFNADWKVQSWDNCYGNLDVLEEVKRIKLSSHILEVFEERGFPLRITNVDHSYQLEYPEEIIYVGMRWQVEAIQPRQVVEYNHERATMSLEEFLKEFDSYLAEQR